MKKLTWQDVDPERETPPVECPDCGRLFTPNSDNERYCSRCNVLFEAQFEEIEE